MNKARIVIIAIFCLAVTGLFLLPASQADTTRTSTKQVTFTKDVAPIFFKNCAECHRAGEAAPFSVMSYKDVRPWAKSIREKVVNKEMPPWHADPHVQQFKNDRRMTRAEIDIITAWVDGGAHEGDPKDLPPTPAYADGWNIGKPDMIITMPEEFTLDADGPDEIQYFEADPGFKEDKYVMMAEARPGNRQIVHHLIAFIRPPSQDGKPAPKLTPEELKKMREEFERDSVFYQDGTLTKVKMDAPVYDDGCSLPSGGSGFKRDGSGSDPNQNALLVGFAPGMPVAKWSQGMVKKIPAGSKIIFQMHYSKAANSAQKDRSMVGLIFAKGPMEKLITTHPVANNYFKIPAGAEKHRVTACWKTDQDITLINAMPHMHLRGKAMEFKVVYPNGKSEVVLNVPRYDFGWQTVYYYKKPIAIPKGSKFIVTAIYDNSAKNKFNPNPNVDIRWGDPTYEDMMIGWLEYSVDFKSAKNATAHSGGGSGEK
ncbi:MAG: cytochrome c [Acidobacteria bacterium]|nr:cytochrome c [Acidobacteriota bacterium]